VFNSPNFLKTKEICKFEVKMNRETILKGKANFPEHFKDIKECGRKHSIAFGNLS